MARISFVTDEAAPPEVEEVYEAADRDFGIIFNTYRVLAHRPEIADAWHRLLASILGSGDVDPQLKTLAFTAASEANECNYWQSHGSGLVEATGGTEEKAASVADSDSSNLYDDREKAVVAYARELAQTATVSEETFENLKKHFPDEPDFVEIHMAAALPNITNRVNNPLRIELEEGIKAVS